jgi:hypothetical protein
MATQGHPVDSRLMCLGLTRAPGTAGEQWQFLGDWVGAASAGSSDQPVGNVPPGGMVEVRLQVGGQLVKSTISLPTPLGIPFAIGMRKVGACSAGSR